MAAMAADHSSRLKSWVALRRSSLYQSFIKRKKSAAAKMSDASVNAQKEKEQPQHTFLAAAASVPLSVEVTANADDEPGPSDDSSNQPSCFHRSRSQSSASLRLSNRLRRSLNLSSLRERSETLKTGGEIEAVSTDVKPSFSDSGRREGTFTKFANIKIVNYDASFGTIDMVRQALRRNRSDDIKKILRKTNWPVGHEIRADLWQEICRHENADFNEHRGAYMPEIQGWEDLDGRFTPKVHFLHASDTIRNNYELTDDGLAALHRLIRALDNAVPTLNYAPMLRPLLALFLHYMSEEDAYACAFWLVKNHSAYMAKSAVAHKASSYTLLSIVKNHKGAAYKSLKNWIGTSEEEILAKALYDWPTWIFCSLPFDYLIRIIDCYLYEGSKILIRIAVALLHIWHKNIKKPKDLDYKTVKERTNVVASSIVQSSKHSSFSLAALFEAATGIRNLRSSKIAQLQEDYEKFILNTEGADPPLPDIPAMHTKPFISAIVSPKTAFHLMCNLPEKFQLKTPLLIYHLAEHGTSFHHFWPLVDEAEQSLLIIKTDKGEVLGAYCDGTWKNRTKKRESEESMYFGGGYSFVWNMGENDEPNVYSWKQKQPEYFMAASCYPKPNLLLIGGGAIEIRNELVRGSSAAGMTFNNPELVKGGSFVIEDIEVFRVCQWESTSEEEQKEKLKDVDKDREKPVTYDQEDYSPHGADAGLGKFFSAPGLVAF